MWDSAHQVHSRVSNVNFVLCGWRGEGGAIEIFHVIVWAEGEGGAIEIFHVCPDVDSLC